MAAVIDLDIRPLEPSDARAAYDLVSHPEVAGPLGRTPFDSVLAFEQSFRDSFNQPGTERLGAFNRGALAGLVELQRGARPRLSHVAQLTLAVRRSEQRRGIGTTLLSVALDAADRW